MKSVFIFLFLSIYFVPVLGIAQEQNPNKNPTEHLPVILNSTLDSLREQNDYVIAFRVLSNIILESNHQYLIFTKNSNFYEAFKWTKKLEKWNVNNETQAIFWSIIQQNDILNIKNEKELVDVCPKKYHIYNSYSYEFTILSKKHINHITYYYPEYYDEVCPGLPERKKIINTVAVIDLLMRKQNY